MLTATLVGAYQASILHPGRRRPPLLRPKYDAVRTLDRLATRLRDEVDLRTLQAEGCAAVADTLQPTHVSLWLRGGTLR